VQNPYLEWTDENQVLCRLEVVDRVFIGRTCKGIVDTKRIIVDHPNVSRDHAEISLSGSVLQLTDRSKNGTWVHNVRVAPGSTKVLNHGDVVQVGDALIYVAYPKITSLEEDDDWSVPVTRISREHLIVTHLVADVRGFTRVSQTVESEQVYEFIKEIFDTFSIIVHDNKGTIKDYAGDAVYAFWEHGEDAYQEQAVMACRTAIKQAQTSNQLRAKLGATNPAAESLKLGWGITTGKVTMSHYGSRASDMALVGDSTNLAFRLSGMANKDLAGEIIICSTTAELVGDILPLDDLGLASVRGRTSQERVWAVRLEVPSG
jgi:class 3 adenylate cyclase